MNQKVDGRFDWMGDCVVGNRMSWVYWKLFLCIGLASGSKQLMERPSTSPGDLFPPPPGDSAPYSPMDSVHLSPVVSAQTPGVSTAMHGTINDSSIKSYGCSSKPKDFCQWASYGSYSDIDWLESILTVVPPIRFSGFGVRKFYSDGSKHWSFLLPC